MPIKILLIRYRGWEVASAVYLAVRGAGVALNATIIPGPFLLIELWYEMMIARRIRHRDLALTYRARTLAFSASNSLCDSTPSALSFASFVSSSAFDKDADGAVGAASTGAATATTASV